MGKWLMRGDPQLSIHRRRAEMRRLKLALARPCSALDVDREIHARLDTAGINYLLDLVTLFMDDLRRKGFSGSQIETLKAALRPHQLRIPMNVVGGMRNVVRALIRRQRLHGLSEKGRRSRSRRSFRSAGDEED